MEALGNILDNAIKYTNTGGITIKLCSYELFACVEVTDTGIGIGEEEHAAVFGRFTGETRLPKKERCGDRTVSGTFYHAAAGRIYPAFVRAWGRLNVWAVFSNGNCVKTVRIFFSPGQILERILCDNLKRRQEMPNQEQKEITGWSFWKPEI